MTQGDMFLYKTRHQTTVEFKILVLQCRTIHYLWVENAFLLWSIQFWLDLLSNKIWYMLYLHIVHLCGRTCIYTQIPRWNVLEMIHYWNARILGVRGHFTHLHSTVFLLIFYRWMCLTVALASFATSYAWHNILKMKIKEEFCL